MAGRGRAADDAVTAGRYDEADAGRGGTDADHPGRRGRTGAMAGVSVGPNGVSGCGCSFGCSDSMRPLWFVS